MSLLRVKTCEVDGVIFATLIGSVKFPCMGSYVRCEALMAAQLEQQALLCEVIVLLHRWLLRTLLCEVLV
jgi:hypothetical protein